MEPPHVLLGVSGGIAACKAPDLVRRLRERGAEVRCCLTRAAAVFVAPRTLEVLSGGPLLDDGYLTGGGADEAHVTLAAWADLLVVAPATAHTLARLSLGLADDALTTTALGVACPWLLAPAMHPAMWTNPATRWHVERLRDRGAELIGPVEGPLASGEVGMGRMSEPAAIAAAAVTLLGRRRALAGRRVLVTAGPTREPIDPVRYLANRSSGKMGFALAAEAARQGASVTLVAGPVSLATPSAVQRVDVETALQMRDAVLARAKTADLVVMAAAVSDFRPRRAAPGKLKRAAGLPSLDLDANPDILVELASAAPEALRVGFAAETGGLEEEGPAKLARKRAHFIVANDVSRSDIGFGADHNEVTVFRATGAPLRLPRQTKEQLAGALLALFAEALAERATDAAD